MRLYRYRVTDFATNKSVIVNAFNSMQARVRAAQQLNVPHDVLSAVRL